LNLKIWADRKFFSHCCVHYKQEFPGHGRFEGRVVDFDGNKRYEVHYPQDGDEEVIDESELEKLEILTDGNDDE
jgi:hypothetical protein